MKKIIIGARGSNLSLIQTKIIKELLLVHNPKLQVEIKIIKTTGDTNMSPIPLDTVGKGWFTKELDNALLKKTIDVAVHSLKDLPEMLPDELCIAAIPEREDAREALVTKNGLKLADLPKGAIIGTDSTRRKTQVLHKRKDLVIQSIRGNIDRRIEKLDKGQYDALVLAVAGLKRLELTKRITEYFSIADMIPSPGQGALAVVTRKSDTTLNKFLKKINHQSTIKEVTAERAFSQTFGGGCKMPVGAYAISSNKTMKLYGMVGSLDGKHIKKATLVGGITNPQSLGKKLANQLLQKARWYTTKRFVVVTRPAEENEQFAKQLEKIGIDTFSYPTITITKNLSAKIVKPYFDSFSSINWVIFTSKNGVRHFMNILKILKIDRMELTTKQIAAVGTTTAEEIKKQKLPVHFIPSTFTTNNLGKEITNIKGKKLLLARSAIANVQLEKILQKRGASVVNLPIYKTESFTPDVEKLTELIKNGQISCITFTSPSTVTGFVKSIKHINENKEIFSIPVVSIGPVTTKAAKQHGFQLIYTAERHTIDGMLIKLKQVIL